MCEVYSWINDLRSDCGKRTLIVVSTNILNSSQTARRRQKLTNCAWIALGNILSSVRDVRGRYKNGH